MLVASSFVAFQALVAAPFVSCHAFAALSLAFCAAAFVFTPGVSPVLLDLLHPTVAASTTKTAESNNVFLTSASVAVKVPF